MRFLAVLLITVFSLSANAQNEGSLILDVNYLSPGEMDVVRVTIHDFDEIESEIKMDLPSAYTVGIETGLDFGPLLASARMGLGTASFDNDDNESPLILTVAGSGRIPFYVGDSIMALGAGYRYMKYNAESDYSLTVPYGIASLQFPGGVILRGEFSSNWFGVGIGMNAIN